MSLRVLGRVTSINVRKVVWLADEIGLTYEREDWGVPLRDPKVPEFLALNPNGLVPVIVDDGFVLWESNAIMRYLAEKDGQLLPADAQGRALVDQWLSWQVGELNPLWGYAVNALLRKNPAYNDQARIADSIGKWGDRLAVLDGHLQKSPFVAGAEFGLADIAVGLSSHRWFSTPIDNRRPFPAVEAHYHKMQARPAGAPWLTAQTP
jgi:glutathione S-transferase